MRTRMRLAIAFVVGLGSVGALAQEREKKSLDANADGYCDTVGSVNASTPARLARPLTAVDECALKPRDAFKECDVCPEMIVVPAGSFMMGSPENEDGHSPNEGPLHRVTFTRAFAVGRFAVTFDEWDSCVANNGCNAYRPPDHGWGRGRQPVIYVSWNDAKTYAEWLSRKTGKTYRLLSEAEWEYVARGGTATPFWFGSAISAERANYDGGRARQQGGSEKVKLQTLPVDAFAENPWGFYQVHGNVSQWTEDCYNEDYQGAPADGTAWVDGDCSSHVLRGGSLVDEAKYLRAASRNGDPADTRTFDDGFRIARTLHLR